MESEVKICASYLVLCGLPALLFVNDFLMIKCEETTTDLFLNIMDKNMREKAMVDVVVLRKRNGSLAPTDTIQLTGIFSSAGTINNAKGYLRHIRLCTESNDSVWSRFEYMPWIAIFTLQENDEDIHNPFCFPPIDKVNMAIAKGAEAVIVDVTENEAAAKQFKKLQGPVSTKPIVIIRGKEAGQLRKAMLLDVEAIGKIQSSAPVDRDKSNHETDSHRDYYTISIFLGTLLVLSLISIAAILKFKGRWNKKEPCATQIAKRVLKSMETRKFNFSDHWFVTESCAVCLEEYTPGQEVRILPCRHEFHKSCVDGWLINRRTCPLCLSNILDRPNSSRDGYIYTSKQPSCSAGYRRRYDVIDDASDADQLGYRQDYYHGDSFVGGYISDGGGLDAVVGSFETGIGFSTQAIITDYPQQQQQQQPQQDFMYRGHHLGIIESQGFYHGDDPDSAEEVGASCRTSFGFDRASARERHRRFSGRRSISSSSYWSGGSRSIKSRRSIIPEYSRLRIKQRSSPSSEQPPSSFEKTPPTMGSHVPPPAPPPLLHSATAQQLQVLPQQHVIQNSPPVQTNQTTYPDQQSSTTLPRCKKLELSSSNHTKKKRPPCCSLDDEDEFIWRSSSTFSTVLALNSGSYRSAIKSGCLGKFGDGSYHLKEEGAGKIKTTGITDVQGLMINDRSKPVKHQNDSTKFAQFSHVAGQGCGKSQNIDNSSHYHTLPSRRFHHHHRHYSKCHQHVEDAIKDEGFTELTIKNTRVWDATEEGRAEDSKTSKKRSLHESHDKYHKSNLIQSCQQGKMFDKFSPAKKEDLDSKRMEDADNKGEVLPVGSKESSKFEGKGASPKVVSISKQPIFIDDRLQCSHPSHYHRRSPQFKVTNLSSVTSTTGALFASTIPFQSTSSTATSSSLTLQTQPKHFMPRSASPHTSNVMLPLSVQTIHRAQRFFVAPPLKPSAASRFNSSILPSTSLSHSSSRKSPQLTIKDESSFADLTDRPSCNKHVTTEQQFLMMISAWGPNHSQ